jgi:hypothetical protein
VSPRLPRSLGSVALALVVLTTLASGCATGKRPTLATGAVDPAKPLDRQALGIAAVDAVVLPLESSEKLTYTAKYVITPTTGKQEVEAIVVQQPDQRSVTIGEVRFLHGATDTTCNLTKKTCEPGILEQRVSNIPGATSTFDRAAPATRIRLAAPAAKATLFPSSEAFELLNTTCVNFPNGKAADTYCVLPTGQLARLERNDATITLKSLSPDIDPAAFTRPDAG